MKSKSKLNIRLFIVAVLLSLFGLTIISRLFFLQVVSHTYYETLAERQHISSINANVRRGTVDLLEKDGGLFRVASTNSGYLVYVDPRKIENIQDAYNRLSVVLPEISMLDFVERASKKDDPYEVIFHRVENETAQKVLDLEISGVGISPEEWRSYPAHELASHVLGFVGYKDDVLTGRYGIEYSRESILRGEKYYLSGRRTLAGTFLDWGKKIFPGTQSSGNIILTIEPQVQLFAEKVLKSAYDKQKAERAGIIIMDPQTGRILSMASFPDFDPNLYNEVESLGVFVNPAIEHIYELGSVFKPLTLAAGLDAGKISTETTYFDYGYLLMDGKRIENYDGKGRGLVDMQEILNQSLNTGAVFVMRQVGSASLKNYFEGFGLSEKTGIELPGEVAGNLKNMDSKREIESATASFGQGIAVTPLEFLRAISVLANGGKLVRPFIIDRVMFDGVPDEKTVPQIEDNVIKPQTSEDITRMLVRVVDEALLGGVYKNEHYTIAAKTGTAQMPDESGSGYSNEFLHSFFGYAPAFNAKFAIVIFLVKPNGAQFASQSLTEPFMEVMNFLLSYYKVPPDR